MTADMIIDSTEERKARGAYFTPPALTRFMTEWAIKSSTDRVLEPSCGDGAFLMKAVERLGALKGRAAVEAYELHPASAAKATQLLATHDYPGRVVVGDFLASTAAPTFNAVIGNPPYIRYQAFTGEARSRGTAAALAQGVQLSRLASSWAPFVIHSAGFLQPTGRLALVVPAELLAANYAQEVRDFLLRRFARVSLVLIGKRVFHSAQTQTVLLLAEGTGGTDRLRFAAIDHPAELGNLNFETKLPVGPGERWTAALVSSGAERELAALEGLHTLAPLESWGRLSLGAVTGNNRYFTLSPAQAADWGLAATDVVPISPPGSTHLRALTLTSEGNAALGVRGARTLLFRPEKPSSGAVAYIAHGEEMGVQNAYKCRVRTPWWRTPLPGPPDLFFTYMNQGTPQLAANPDRLHYLNSIHGLYLRPERTGLAELLALAALNSATALSAEVTGRAYGGGILKMEPREAARLLVPSMETVLTHRSALNAVLSKVRGLLREGNLEAARGIVDEIVLGPDTVPDQNLDLIRDAHRTLAGRRHRRSRSDATSRGSR